MRYSENKRCRIGNPTRFLTTHGLSTAARALQGVSNKKKRKKKETAHMGQHGWRVVERGGYNSLLTRPKTEENSSSEVVSMPHPRRPLFQAAAGGAATAAAAAGASTWANCCGANAGAVGWIWYEEVDVTVSVVAYELELVTVR